MTHHGMDGDNHDLEMSDDPGHRSPLVLRLAMALEAAGVSYCHWKSNAHLEDAMRAETDLDLLIAREHATTFEEALGRCGFIRASRGRDTHMPGTAHHFAYDASLDRFVHVHAHYQLVVGHDRSKNFRLPVESGFLASRSNVAGVIPTPSPEFEYVVFVIRMALKYAIWDELLWEGLRGRRAGPRISEKEEWAQLRQQVDPAEVGRLVAELLPYIEGELFVDLEAAVSGRRSLLATLAAGRRLQRALEPHARVSTRVDGWLRLWRRMVLFVMRRVGRLRGFQLESGGAIVAVMGGDGAGKSTAISDVARWLGDEFDVTRVHLGKPPRSHTPYGVRGALMVADRAQGLVRSAGKTSGTDREAGLSFDDFRRIGWLACIARDRRRAYEAARRRASQGSIVISDRFPHPALKVMDVAQIGRRFPLAESSRVARLLMQAEERYHSAISAPDIAIVLVVDPREAARRKTDERFEYVLERSQEIWEMDWKDTGVVVVDAGRPPEDVAAEIKEIIWDRLA